VGLADCLHPLPRAYDPNFAIEPSRDDGALSHRARSNPVGHRASSRSLDVGDYGNCSWPKYGVERATAEVACRLQSYKLNPWNSASSPFGTQRNTQESGHASSAALRVSLARVVNKAAVGFVAIEPLCGRDVHIDVHAFLLVCGGRSFKLC
jgi:hypothetical protein